MRFLQFLYEGGAATAKLGTERVSKADLDEALSILEKKLNISDLENRLLGSTRLVHAGHQDDSGDIDLAIDEDDKERIVEILGDPVKLIGGSTYSYALELERKTVQVDLMFVPDLEWAKFSHHASENSRYKSGVRNELLHSLVKYAAEPGKDLRLNLDGQPVIRASRSYKLDSGLERIFKMAPKRKDGQGRVKAMVKATPEELESTMKELGLTGKFSHDPEIIRDPQQFAKVLFGHDVDVSKLNSTESLIELIVKNKTNYKDILADAAEGMKNRGFPVPKELTRYITS